MRTAQQWREYQDTLVPNVLDYWRMFQEMVLRMEDLENQVEHLREQLDAYKEDRVALIGRLQELEYEALDRSDERDYLGG